MPTAAANQFRIWTALEWEELQMTSMSLAQVHYGTMHTIAYPVQKE